MRTRRPAAASASETSSTLRSSGKNFFLTWPRKTPFSGGRPSEIDGESVDDEFTGYASRLSPHIGDVSLLLDQRIKAGQSVLFEGAQGALLDIDHGTYPFVTSSSSTAGGVATGLGIGPTRIDAVLGVAKAYTTRVGSGPFPHRMPRRRGRLISERGSEFGATTGRPAAAAGSTPWP